ncbi:MAG: MotA/TolQ/ExbB proton channel family protein [Planctomycetota bacterium]
MIDLLPCPPLAVHELIWGHSIQDLFQMGGPVMLPLLICSVLAVAIIFERLVLFGRIGGVPKKMVRRVADAVREGRDGEAEAILTKAKHPVAKVLHTQLANRARPAEQRAQLVQREGGLLIERLEARLSPLLLIAQAAPLLGLLGTVSGLVGSFWKLEQINGPVEPSDLASGIWAALLTTVFGLVVGIPASAAWHLLQDRADGFARHLGFAVTDLEEGITRPASPPAAPAAAEEETPAAPISGAAS